MTQRWNEMQLRFDLDLDEIADAASEQAISPEEARQISEAARQALEKRSQAELPEWFQDYVRLLQQGWPWRVAVYIAWASSPRVGRWPETLEKLATEVLGLASPRVIFTWRRKYPSINSVVAMMQAAPLWEHRRDVIAALVKNAATADYKTFNDRKLFLEMTGDYVPRSQLDLGKAARNDLSELSDAELDELLGDELEGGDGAAAG